MTTISLFFSNYIIIIHSNSLLLHNNIFEIFIKFFEIKNLKTTPSKKYFYDFEQS